MTADAKTAVAALAAFALVPAGASAGAKQFSIFEDDAVLLGEREIGWVASAARHYELGHIATAIIKRSVDPAADLVVRTASGDIAAGQEPVILVR